MPKRVAASFGRFLKNAGFGDLFENFTIAALAAILVVRIALYLTDYPQLGGGPFHVAHVLWGGFLMLGALLILLGFLDANAKRFASVMGGVGFGLFVDELGKFVTRDNDYFFQPTIAFIYAIFVGLFFIARALERLDGMAPEEYAANALEIFREALARDLDPREKAQALAWLDRADGADASVIALRNAIAALEPTVPVHSRGWKARAAALRERIIHARRFSGSLIAFFVAAGTVNAVKAMMLFRSADSFVDIGQVVTALISGALIILGTAHLIRRRRLLGYSLYRIAVMISIFFTQFFLFYKEQLSAAVGLAVNIAVYLALRYLIAEEEDHAAPGRTS